MSDDLISTLKYIFGEENVVVLGGRMEGVVVRIMAEKRFGFIRADEDAKEYFFHQSDLNGFFDDLVNDVENGQKVRVEFESVESQKGPRAANVKRLDWPNQ